MKQRDPLIVGAAARRMQKAPKRPSSVIRTVSGTRLSGGQIAEDPNENLRGRDWVEAQERMAIDPQMQAGHAAVKNSQLASTFSFQPVTGESDEPDAESAACADWLNRKFGFAGYPGEMKVPFERQLRTLLDFQFLGYRYAEEVYQRDADGEWFLWYYRDCQPRAHQEWLYDEHEELVGIRQIDVNGSRSGADELPELSANKMLLLTLDQQGSNFEGRGMDRPSWFWQSLKQHAADQMAIALERVATGITTAKYNRRELMEEHRYSEDDIDGKDNPDSIRGTLEAMLANLAAGEDSTLVIPEGVTCETKYNDAFDPERFATVISLCDLQMLISMLAQYLSLGQNGTGSYALSQTHMDLFLEAGRNVLDLVCGAIGGPAGPGTGTVGRLLNWHTRFHKLPPERRPRLVHNGLSSIPFEQLSTGIPALKEAGAWTVVNGDEQQIRRTAGFPPLPAKFHRTPEERQQTDPILNALAKGKKST